jgi:penicillin-binding protein 1A
MKRLGQIFIFLTSLGILGAIASVLLMVGVIYKFGQDLPDFAKLKDYKPPVVTRVHAGDGRFLAEFAQEKRIFVPIDEIPPMVKQAFLAAEDKNFYQHKGVDVIAVARAVFVNFKNRAEGRRPVGASTITQQVAKNFLLSNELSYKRKIREAILAYRIEQSLSKDRILELYLNEIFLGARSYGVAAASLHYFGKTLAELNIEEVAYLAALPKAPNNYHPVRNIEAAMARRNWVIERMRDDGYIVSAEAALAEAKPLTVISRNETDIVDAPYYAEEVRRILLEQYGEDELYQGGLSARTPLDPTLQEIAEGALQHGLIQYDRRKGWRGAIAQADGTNGWQKIITDFARPEGMASNWRLAIVLSRSGSDVKIGFSDKSTARIRNDDVTWSDSKPLKSGDIIFVEPPDDPAFKGQFYLRQIPRVEGALVALDPFTGRVLAMQGGWKFDKSVFNRVTQAKRQPGSAFKPFIYLAALDKGYTPSSIINDAPLSFTDSTGAVWEPENYSGKYYGPTPLRVGVEKSRNLMTIRLTQNIGMDSVVEYAKKFGISDNMEPHLANALGSTETTLLALTTAYGMIANGGQKITPIFIDRIQDRYGKTIYKADNRTCPNCGSLVNWKSQSTPNLETSFEQIADPRTCYQMTSIMEGVIQRGTAMALNDLGYPIAGKTGTTNDSKDAWFIGYTPNLVVGVYVGFDNPKSLGEKETGASLAVPIFKDFMERALMDVPPSPFRVPQGVRLLKVNPSTGRITSTDDPNAIWEAFIPGTEPNNNDYTAPTNYNGSSSNDSEQNNEAPTIPQTEQLEPQLQFNPDEVAPNTGTGGIY